MDADHTPLPDEVVDELVAEKARRAAAEAEADELRRQLARTQGQAADARAAAGIAVAAHEGVLSALEDVVAAAAPGDSRNAAMALRTQLRDAVAAARRAALPSRRVEARAAGSDDAATSQALAATRATLAHVAEQLHAERQLRLDRERELVDATTSPRSADADEPAA